MTVQLGGGLEQTASVSEKNMAAQLGFVKLHLRKLIKLKKHFKEDEAKMPPHK